MACMKCRALRSFLAAVIAFQVTSPIWAWGPHTQITRAALAVVPDVLRLQKKLGDDWDRIARDYCWMADWRLAVRPDHYADDYLLFPGMPRHLDHMLPEARKAYVPHFRRALQAIRTESPQNAARWVGSLLHFVQDSGSPPHTAGVTGLLHTKMENWVDEKQIEIGDYKPVLLGKTDDEAETGFLRRMELLIEFSRERALKLKPILEKLNERENQPLELESALETARVTADTVFTLYTLRQAGLSGCELAGKVEYRVPKGYAKVPAKIMLAGTAYSTTTDEEGRFRFRHLPAGRYSVEFLATGFRVARADVVLSIERPTSLDVQLVSDPIAGNLVRNSAFDLSWINRGQPDWWSRDSAQQSRWSSALIRVPVDQKCCIHVNWGDLKDVPLFARWRTNPAVSGSGLVAPITLDKGMDMEFSTAIVVPPKSLTPFEKGFLYLEILIESTDPLSKTCDLVAVTFQDPETK